jgi:hypothetical protein
MQVERPTERFAAMLCSCFFSYSYSASRYSYSYSYSIDPSETVSVRWINRVNIDTIRFKLVFPIRLGSESIASNDKSIS